MLTVRLLYIANLWKYHSDEKGNQMSGCVCDLLDVPTTYARLLLHSILLARGSFLSLFLQPSLHFPFDCIQPWRHYSDPMRAQLQALILQQRLPPVPTNHASSLSLLMTSTTRDYNVEFLAQI